MAGIPSRCARPLCPTVSFLPIDYEQKPRLCDAGQEAEARGGSLRRGTGSQLMKQFWNALLQILTFPYTHLLSLSLPHGSLCLLQPTQGSLCPESPNIWQSDSFCEF